MARQSLDDGRWFDTEKARHWKEDTEFDGNNMVSVATGTQWDHQVLWCTAGGAWVLHAWSQWQGRGESWEVVSPQQATSWLIANGHDADAPAKELAELEV